LAEKVASQLEDCSETLLIQAIGPVVGAHAGPGAVGIGCYPAEMLPLGLKLKAGTTPSG
jgi:fatty acid-binding protein DegV